MPVVSLFSGIFCSKDPVVSGLSAVTGYKLMRDKAIVSEASRISGLSIEKIERTFSDKTSVFNKFTHERERSVAYLRLALAQMLSSENLIIIEGFVSLLIPEEISHVLRVCLIADMPFRVSTAMKEDGLSDNDARRLIQKHDRDCAAWVHALFDMDDPWDASLYDVLLPTDKTGVEEVIGLIKDNLRKEAVKATERSEKAVDDFLLSANVEVGLIKEGHNTGVRSKEGSVTLTINKHVLMLSRLEEELKSIASQVQGVKSVKVLVGPGFHQTDIYRRHDFAVPSKLLLVDDEREFVETLSERLLLREMGSAVAYDGESALELIKTDEPEVMILDLRMPGIDGIGVLRRVKQTNPDIEVIILTGHGSEADRETCMRLGAFAYLQKPVNIDELSEAIKGANGKIRQKETDVDSQTGKSK